MHRDELLSRRGFSSSVAIRCARCHVAAASWYLWLAECPWPPLSFRQSEFAIRFTPQSSHSPSRSTARSRRGSTPSSACSRRSLGVGTANSASPPQATQTVRQGMQFKSVHNASSMTPSPTPYTRAPFTFFSSYPSQRLEARISSRTVSGLSDRNARKSYSQIPSTGGIT